MRITAMTTFCFISWWMVRCRWGRPWGWISVGVLEGGIDRKNQCKKVLLTVHRRERVASLRVPPVMGAISR